MRQKKMIKWFGIFLAVMLAFTILSRAADSVSVAQVQVKTLQNQIVTHKVSGIGKVEGIREQAVFVLENMRVEQVLVQEGKAAKKDETLFVLSMESIQEAVKDKEDEIEELNLKIRDLESQMSVSEQKRNAEQAWARQSYQNSAQSSNVTVDNARLEVQVAQERLNDFYRKREQQAYAGTASDEEGFTDGAEGFSDGQEEADDEALEQALLDDLRLKQEALNSAIAASNQEMTGAGKTIQDASLPEASDGTLENAERELKNRQEELEKLKTLLAEGGAVKAPADGVVKSLEIATGSLTTSEAAAVLYLTGGNLRMVATISRDDLKYVQAGADVTIEKSIGKEIAGAVVEAIREDETDEDAVILSIQIPEDTLSIGESAEFTISSEAGPFSCCVPLSAIHEENGNAFVYVMDRENTVLGEVLVARRAEVTIKDKNQSLAALENGSLAGDQKVIVDADREITDGSRVRLQEN